MVASSVTQGGFRGYKKQRRRRKDGQHNLRATTPEKSMHSAGVREAIAMFLPARTAARAWDHAKRRTSLNILPAMKFVNAHRPGVPAASDDANCAKLWVAANVMHPSERRSNPDGFVVPDSLWTFAPRKLTPGYVPELVDAWARFFHTCRTAFTAQHGLHVFARVAFARDVRVLSGYTEDYFVDAGTAARVGPFIGSLLGPLALVNAACATHANITFIGGQVRPIRDGVRPPPLWHGRARRCIAVGEQILANYRVGDTPLRCSVCDKEIRGASN